MGQVLPETGAMAVAKHGCFDQLRTFSAPVDERWVWNCSTDVSDDQKERDRDQVYGSRPDIKN